MNNCLEGAIWPSRNQIAPEMPGEDSPEHVVQTGCQSKPCGLEMQIAAPSILIGQHVSIAGGHGVTRRWQMQVEPRMRVDVADLAPVKARVRQDNFSSGDE